MIRAYASALLLCLALPAGAESFAEISGVQDRVLLARIDERVAALQIDVLEMQKTLVGLQITVTEVRLDAARSGATYGALGGIFSATLSILLAAAAKAWFEQRNTARVAAALKEAKR